MEIKKLKCFIILIFLIIKIFSLSDNNYNKFSSIENVGDLIGNSSILEKEKKDLINNEKNSNFCDDLNMKNKLYKNLIIDINNNTDINNDDSIDDTDEFLSSENIAMISYYFISFLIFLITILFINQKI